jgi:hypothetical protein
MKFFWDLPRKLSGLEFGISLELGIWDLELRHRVGVSVFRFARIADNSRDSGCVKFTQKA